MWVKPAPISEAGPIYVPGETDPAIETAQRLLAKYGYGVNATGHLDGTTRDTVIAFQRHFRPSRIDGVLDPSTLTTLKALIEARDAKHAQPMRSGASLHRRLVLRALTARGSSPSLLRQSAGRPLGPNAERRPGGKSGLHGHTVPDNVRRARA